MKESKQPRDVLGSKNGCINFSMCPLCYGCRNYRYEDESCEECLQDGKKKNICNTEKHQSELIAKFITRNKIELKGDINFKNN
jgi:hypothetical protein